MIEGYMFEDHELIRRAATECMCNLAMSKEVRLDPGSHVGRRAEVPVPWVGLAPADLVSLLLWPQVQDLFEAEGNDRLKLLVLYSGEDDELLRRAAAGGLAMLTSMRPSLCNRIPQVVSASSLRGSEWARAPAWQWLVGVPLPGFSLLLSVHTALFPTDHALAGDPAVSAPEPQPGAAAPGCRGGTEHGGGLQGDCQHLDGE